MEYVRGLEAYDGTQDTAVTLGKFDGLHRGHQKLIQGIQRKKEAYGVRTMVFAFDMLPFYERRGLPREGLLTNEERRQHLEGQVDILLECPFIDAVSGTPAEEFITRILCGRFHARYVVVGTDFTFGYKARGTPEMLAAFAERCGYELTVEEKERCRGREISSTYVKEELKKGNMETVRELLGYPYEAGGILQSRLSRGELPGTPVLALCPPAEKLLPAEGVYLAQVCAQGSRTAALACVDTGAAPSVELRLLEAGSAMQGGPAAVRFLRFLRPRLAFASDAERRAQAEADLAFGSAYFREERGDER